MRRVTVAWLALVALVFLPASEPRAEDEPTLEQMIGQMILVGFKGTSASQQTVQAIGRRIEQGRIGGVILFKRNIQSPAQVAKLNAYLKGRSKGPKLFVAVDEEGGKVQRLTKRKGFKHQPSAAWVASKSPETARQIYLCMARELKQAGFNVNFGPVVDINLNPDNPIIGKLGRSFGKSDAKVMTYAREFIEAHWQHGIVTCAKHFPGHGSASGDTHKVEAHIDAINRNQETQVYLDLAQKKLLDSVMVAHLLTKNERSLPATLDPERYQFLRSMVGFQGVAFSDDMNMEAVRKRFSFEDGLVMTVNAGTDVVVLGNVLHYDPQIAKKAFDILLASVKAGKIKKSRIEEAYRRIIKLKNKYH
jgi:beta-N-acetylhexosaminidase